MTILDNWPTPFKSFSAEAVTPGTLRALKRLRNNIGMDGPNQAENPANRR